MASQARSDEGAITAINVTPLVDVMLVLLAIFMLTAKLADEDSAVPLDLPKAASGEVTQRVLRVTIDAEGTRRVFGAEKQTDGREVADDGAFRALAERVHREHPDVRTIIEAAGHADHEHVIAALDTLRLAGITKIAFAVEPKPQAIETAP